MFGDVADAFAVDIDLAIVPKALEIGGTIHEQASGRRLIVILNCKLGHGKDTPRNGHEQDRQTATPSCGRAISSSAARLIRSRPSARAASGIVNGGMIFRT